jgi:hypothetical protein
MPLEAINDLFIKAVAKNPSALLKSPGNNPGLGMISVTKDFFQTAPGKITAESAENDVLGFFSLVMSYAKSAAAAAFDESPKQKFSIMPRSDFITLYNQVKSAVNPPLYDIVKILACYDTNPSGPR